MRTECVRTDLTGLSVPTITIPPSSERGKVHKPHEADIEGPIIEALTLREKQGNFPVQVGRYALLDIPSLMPHTKGEPEDSMVGWVVKKNGDGTIIPWDWSGDAGWLNLASEGGEFLSEVEHFGRTVVEEGNSFFFVFGSHLRKKVHPHVSEKGLMSQFRTHFHWTRNRAEPDSVMELQDNLDRDQLLEWKLYLDYGAEVARHELETRLKGFGGRDFANNMHQWDQHEGKVKRAAFGFNSLVDVVKQLSALEENIGACWRHIVPSLADEYASNYLFPCQGGTESLLLLPPRTTAAVWIPNNSEKHHMKLPQDDQRIWVSPFSLVDKKPLVSGTWTRR